MSNKWLGLFGAGGYAREVMPMAREQYLNRKLVFIEDIPRSRSCNDHGVVSFAEFASEGGEITIAIGDPKLRRNLAVRCREAGLEFFSVQSSQSLMMDDIVVGEGALLSPFTIITSNARIGVHFQCNLYSYVAHDCVIGDFVTFAPAVRCNGNVTIGDNAYIGTGAIIRQGLTIGAGAVVGMGAVVTRDVPAGETWVGNPAKSLRR